MDGKALTNPKALADHLPELTYFRRALRRVDWEVYGRIMEKVTRHEDAYSNSPSFDPAVALFLCVLIENEKEIQALKREMILRDYVEEGMED